MRTFAFVSMDALPDLLPGNPRGQPCRPNRIKSAFGWGLAGIVKKGLDMHPTTHQAEGMSPIFDRSKIWVEGEPLTTSILDDLIAAIPADDPAIPYWVTALVPVGQLRR